MNTALLPIAAVVLMAPLAMRSATAEQPARPNVLFIAVDDLRPEDRKSVV